MLYYMIYKNLVKYSIIFMVKEIVEGEKGDS